eukprot:11222593-Ditylum_brightwellii.AAC.1
MPSQEGTGSKTARMHSTRVAGLQMYQGTNTPDITTEIECAQDKNNQLDNNTTEGDDTEDQPEPSRYSTRICKPVMLFNPGIGLTRNWSSDMKYMIWRTKHTLMLVLRARGIVH